jgi:ACS family glucarate transporter-like MFS transporter
VDGDTLAGRGGAAGNWISGAVVDHLYKQGKWGLSRRLPAVIGFLLAAFGVMMFLRMETVLSAVLFLTLALLGADMTLSSSWSFCVDVGHKHAGTVSATMNMAGNLGSFITGLAYAYLKDWTGSVHAYFFLAAGLEVLAALAWMMMKPENALEEY